MPLFDLEMFAKTFDILDQIPGRVLFEAGAPTKTHTQKEKRSVDRSELVALWSNARHGLSSSTLVQEDHLEGSTDVRETMQLARHPDLIFPGIEEAAIFLVASSAGTTSVRD